MDREKEEEAIAFAPIFHKILDHQLLPEQDHDDDDVYEDDDEEEEVTSSDSSSEEFEFSFAPNFQGDTGSSVEDLADGIFSNGQIRPVYPVFNRKLAEERDDLKELEFSFGRVLIEDDREERSKKEEERFTESVPVPESYCEWIPKSRSIGGSSSRRWNLMDLVVGRSHSDGKQKFSFRRVLIEDDREERSKKEEERFTESVPTPESYCEWIPKSRSTGGSSSRRWNLMDLVVGRSHSDGKQKFLFLSPPSSITASNTDNAAVEKKKMKKKVRVREMDMVTAHKLYYGREGGVGERKQQSYLPYRRNLVGFHPF